VIRVLLVAASPALRAGLRSLLAADARVRVIGEAARLNEFDDIEADDSPLSAVNGQIVVILSAPSPGLDLPLPESIPLLLLTDSPLPPADALRSRPAFGLLPSDASPEELLAAVHALAEGLIVGARALLNFAPATSIEIAERSPLTERELETLNLLATGLPNKQIAVALGISEHTVKFHISSIYSKLNASNRAEAIRAGLRGGWIAL
jgi:DNA-binding NarL/FixJ family response regulator